MVKSRKIDCDRFTGRFITAVVKRSLRMAQSLARCLVNQESTRTDYAILLQRFDEERAKREGKEEGNLNGWPPIVEGWFHKAIEVLERQACIFERMSDAGELDYPCTREGCENCCLPKQCQWLKLFATEFDVLCDPSTILNELTPERIKSACFLEILLQNDRFDPAANDSALLRAGAQDFSELIEVLLKDGRADPAANSSEALSLATRRGNVKVVKLLLADGRADPLSMVIPPIIDTQVELIMLHLDIFALYLKDPRFTKLEIRIMFNLAAHNGFSEHVKMMLQGGHFDFFNNNEGFINLLINRIIQRFQADYLNTRRIDILEDIFNDPRLHPLRADTQKKLLDVICHTVKTIDRGISLHMNGAVSYSYLYQMPPIERLRIAGFRHKAFKTTLLNSDKIAYTTRLYYRMFK